MFTFKIVSDGPHRRQRTSSFPEQAISNIRAKDIQNCGDFQASELEAVTEEKSFDWFDQACTQTIEASEDY